MKTKLSLLAACSFAGVLLMSMAPVLFLAAESRRGSCAPEGDVSISAIAATIRHLESGDDYTARATGSSASGAYQFLDSTWSGYGGYARAYLAPPAVQDAKATEHITGILTANHNDPAAVPVTWYIGHVPPPRSSEWDTVPSPGAGNRLTPREYQRKWMEAYRQKVAGTSEATATSGGTATTITTSPACPPDDLAINGSYALPVERHWYDEHPEWFTKPHHDYPAVDIPVPIGTPIFAVTSGVVVSITTGGDCGFGVVINSDDGAQYTYCHGLPGSHAISNGDTVTTGQPLMLSASTGNSIGPHLHFAIRAGGQARCPQPFLVDIAEGGARVPTTLPTLGCSY